jgi:hypothetical protein
MFGHIYMFLYDSFKCPYKEPVKLRDGNILFKKKVNLSLYSGNMS